MPEEIDITEALELCGFLSGDRQESRLMNLLIVILNLQKDPPIPLAFAEIYDQLLKEEQGSKLTKAWVHRVLKSLVDAQLVRVENPSAHRKQYIADVNTVMAGLEQLKSNRVSELEAQRYEIDSTLTDITDLDCGSLAQQFVKNVTGTQQKISSRIVRGVDELHRVLRYNMLDVAKKGDKIRATVLWLGPFVGDSALERTRRFIEAAQRGADVRYMLSTDVFRQAETQDVMAMMKGAFEMLHSVLELRKSGLKFNVRLYDGPNTYNQVSFNNDNMALVITENPVTATWITRDFNPDLIDNAVKAFDKDWRKAKSFLDMTPKEMQSLGIPLEALISEIDNDAKEGPKK